MSRLKRLGEAVPAVWWMTFALLSFTGVMLSFYYAPTATDAWGSVHYIENQVAMGGLIRGLHHFGASALVVLSVLQLVSAFLRNAVALPSHYRWISGVLLLGLALAFCMTGALLPWDQAGYWQSMVETNIMASAPGGDLVRPLAIGGSDLGNLTLTRYYAVHTLVLPAACIGLFLLVRRMETRSGEPPEATADPVRGLWALASFAVVLATVFAAAIALGAPLEAPASANSSYEARPEWYFMALFALRALMEGPLELVATVVLPAAVGGFLIALPWLDTGAKRRRVLGLALGALLLAAAGLTAMPILSDRGDPDYQDKLAVQARHSQAASRYAAASGVRPDGGITLLDGYLLFYRERCAECHIWELTPEEPSAPRLAGYLSRGWVRGFLSNPSHEDYFGRTKLKYSEDDGTGMEPFAGEPGELDALVEFLCSLSGEEHEPALDAMQVAQGQALFTDGECSGCHELSRAEGQGPALGGYGSREWLIGLLKQPAAANYYGEDLGGEMPVYDHLSPRELDSLVLWLQNIRDEAVPRHE